MIAFPSRKCRLRTEPWLAALLLAAVCRGETVLPLGARMAVCFPPPAPVFGDVMAESLRLLAIPPDALPSATGTGVIQAMSQ